MLIFWFNIFQVGVNRVRVNRLMLNFRMFAPVIFNFKTISASSVFGKFFVSSFFTYIFIIPCKFTVCKIRYPIDISKDVKAPLPSNLWSVTSNGSMWVHPNYVITTRPNSPPLHVSTNLQTSEEDIMSTFIPSGNVRGLLVGVDYGWISLHLVQTQYNTPDGMRSIYCNYVRWRRFSYERQQS